VPFTVKIVYLLVDDSASLSGAGGSCGRLPPVRWAAMFGDLEGQLDAAARRELEDEVDDRRRRELARIRLVDRLAAAVDQPLVVTVAGSGAVTGRLSAVGADFLLLEDTNRREALVPVGSVLSVTGLPRLAADPDRKLTVQARLGLAYALRAVARDRSPVVIALTDGRIVTGTVERVAADHLDLTEHGPDETPRPASDSPSRVVTFAGIGMVRSG
jgi:hypothetical protein